MAQRLGIAAALLGDPAVLLFDEPVNGLDPEGIRWIRTLMRSLAAEGRTVIPISIVANSLSTTKPVGHGVVHMLSAGLGMLCLYAALALGVGGWLLARRDA